MFNLFSGLGLFETTSPSPAKRLADALRFRPTIEQLPDRIAPATLTFRGGENALWSVNKSWSEGSEPANKAPVDGDTLLFTALSENGGGKNDLVLRNITLRVESTFPAGNTIQLDQSLGVSDGYMRAGTISGNANLTVESAGGKGTFTVTAGSFGGPVTSRLVVQENASLWIGDPNVASNNTITFNGRGIENNGTITYTHNTIHLTNKAEIINNKAFTAAGEMSLEITTDGTSAGFSQTKAAGSILTVSDVAALVISSPYVDTAANTNISVGTASQLVLRGGGTLRTTLTLNGAPKNSAFHLADTTAAKVDYYIAPEFNAQGKGSLSFSGTSYAVYPRIYLFPNVDLQFSENVQFTTKGALIQGVDPMGAVLAPNDPGTAKIVLGSGQNHAFTSTWLRNAALHVQQGSRVYLVQYAGLGTSRLERSGALVLNSGQAQLGWPPVGWPQDWTQGAVFPFLEMSEHGRIILNRPWAPEVPTLILETGNIVKANAADDTAWIQNNVGGLIWKPANRGISTIEAKVSSPVPGLRVDSGSTLVMGTVRLNGTPVPRPPAPPGGMSQLRLEGANFDVASELLISAPLAGDGVLAGYGTVTASLLTNSGSILPGDTNALGAIDVDGDFTQKPSGTLAIEIGLDSVGGGGAADSVGIIGTGRKVILGGALDLQLIGGYVPTASDNVFTLLLLDDPTSTILGEFDAYPEGMLVDLAGRLYALSYQGGDGNDVTLTAQASPYPNGQWASSVLGYSSQYSAGSWAAAQALGAPDTFGYGDHATAWAPYPMNGSQEFITLGFQTPVYATGVLIRETYGNGFVTQVDLLDENDVYHTIWVGTDPTQPGSAEDFTINFAATAYKVKGVRIFADTDHDPNAWEEIDAVRLLS
jgi:hypothetical protein